MNESDTPSVHLVAIESLKQKVPSNQKHTVKMTKEGVAEEDDSEVGEELYIPNGSESNDMNDNEEVGFEGFSLLSLEEDNDAAVMDLEPVEINQALEGSGALDWCCHNDDEEDDIGFTHEELLDVLQQFAPVDGIGHNDDDCAAENEDYYDEDLMRGMLTSLPDDDINMELLQQQFNFGEETDVDDGQSVLLDFTPEGIFDDVKVGQRQQPSHGSSSSSSGGSSNSKNTDQQQEGESEPEETKEDTTNNYNPLQTTTKTQMELLEEALQALNLEFPPNEEEDFFDDSAATIEGNVFCQPCTTPLKPQLPPPPTTASASNYNVLNTNGRFVNSAAMMATGTETVGAGLDALLESLLLKPDGTILSTEEIEYLLSNLELSSGVEEGGDQGSVLESLQQQPDKLEGQEGEKEESPLSTTRALTAATATKEEKEEEEELTTSCTNHKLNSNNVSTAKPHDSSPSNIVAVKAAKAAESGGPMINNSFQQEQQQHLHSNGCLQTTIGHHQGTVYGVAFSQCGTYLATTSKDTTVKIWQSATTSSSKKTGTGAGPIKTLTGHDQTCLRVAWASPQWAKDSLQRAEGDSHSLLLVTASSDGVVKVWCGSSSSSSNNNHPTLNDNWKCCATIDPATFVLSDENNTQADAEAEDAKTTTTTTKPKQWFASWKDSDFCQPCEPQEPGEGQDLEQEEKPRTCSVQWIDHWKGLPTAGREQNSFLLTSSDDFVHIWEVEPLLLRKDGGDDNSVYTGDLNFVEVMSLHFACFHNHFGYGVSVCRVTDHLTGNATTGGTLNKPSSLRRGGPADNMNRVFIFEIGYCEANGILGVSLSDGSLRLINARGVCISILQMPQSQMSQITAFAWDCNGTRLATCLAMGHVVVWGVKVDDGMGTVSVPSSGSTGVTCRAILEGGHDLGAPVFGSRFFAEEDNRLLTWGVDGRLCLWDSFAQGNIKAPIAVVLANADYPIYSVDIHGSSAVVGGGDETEGSEVEVNIYDINTASCL